MAIIHFFKAEGGFGAGERWLFVFMIKVYSKAVLWSQHQIIFGIVFKNSDNRGPSRKCLRGDLPVKLLFKTTMGLILN